MPSYKGWDKQDTRNPAWKFNRKILVEGVKTEVIVHAYRQGSDVSDPEDYWAELYFSNPEVENKSIKIDSNGQTSNYAQPESSITSAEENCREFLREVHDADTIRAAAKVEAMPGNWDRVTHFEYENPEADKILKVEKDGERTYRMFLYEVTREGRNLLGSVGAGATEEDAEQRLVEVVRNNPRDVSMEDLF